MNGMYIHVPAVVVYSKLRTNPDRVVGGGRRQSITWRAQHEALSNFDKRLTASMPFFYNTYHDSVWQKLEPGRSLDVLDITRIRIQYVMV